MKSRRAATTQDGGREGAMDRTGAVDEMKKKLKTDLTFFYRHSGRLVEERENGDSKKESLLWSKE